MPPHVAAHHNIFQHAHLLRKADVLKGAGKAQTADIVGMQALDALATKQHLPFLRGVKAAEHIEGRGFARAVGADKAHQGVVFNGDGKIRQRDKPAEALRDFFHFKQCQGQLPQ